MDKMLCRYIPCILILYTCFRYGCGYTVTIFPEYFSQNGSVHFESTKWDGHHGLDTDIFLAPNKMIGSRAARWLNADFNNDMFLNAPEDPARRGYPDPSYFRNSTLQQVLVGKYMDDVDGYTGNLGMVMTLNGRRWPRWMNASLHQGLFPNNIDAATELNLQLLAAVQSGTKNRMPSRFEVINEPDSFYTAIDWPTVITYYRTMASKVKSNFPNLRQGGPTYTGAVNSANQNNFKVWNNLRDFLDMSLNNLDFFSFHPYMALYNRNYSHSFSGPNEARLVAILDLVSSYSHRTVDKSVSFVFSEHGLGNIDVDDATPTGLIQWAYAYVRNSFMFTLLNHRGVIEKPVPFLISHAVPNFVNASIFSTNGSETFISSAYRFWRQFNESHQFLRVESEYSGTERPVSPFALVHPQTKSVFVFLHNYKQTPTRVELNVKSNWVLSKEARSTCFYLDDMNIPHFEQDQTVNITQSSVTLLAEASCVFEFSVDGSFSGIRTVLEETHYSRNQVVTTDSLLVQTVNLPRHKVFYTAKLRFAVSTSAKETGTKPKSVHMNDFPLEKFFTLHDPGRASADTYWDVYVYDVPAVYLKPGNNTVSLQFSGISGHVSALAIIVGTLA